jgi:hypothetical protein
VTEPDWVEGGHAPDTYAQVSVHGAGE